MLTPVYTRYRLPSDFYGWYLNEDGSIDIVTGKDQSTILVSPTERICQGEPPTWVQSGNAVTRDGTFCFRVQGRKLDVTHLPIVINGIHYWVDSTNLPLAV